jgi:hypothetical protein
MAKTVHRDTWGICEKCIGQLFSGACVDNCRLIFKSLTGSKGSS